MPHTDSVVVYITCTSDDEADRIAAALVDARLVACTNAIPGMRSCYRWQGEVCHGQETILIAKTLSSRIPDITAAVRDLHQDEVPCITSWPITHGNPDYLAWIREQVEA